MNTGLLDATATGLARFAPLAVELRRQLESREDWLVASPNLVYGSPLTDDAPPMLGLDGEWQHPLTAHADGQIADRLGVQRGLHRRLAREVGPQWAETVNALLDRSPQRRLIRLLDGQVRAVLGSTFLVLDNYDLADMILPRIDAAGGQPASAALTETRMYLKAIFPDRRMRIGPRGDEVQLGITVTNSEVGVGSGQVTPALHTTRCSNLAVISKLAHHQRHVGGAYELPEGEAAILTDETLRAVAESYLLRIRDNLDHVLAPEVWESIVRDARRAAGVEIEDPIGAAESIRRRCELTDHEHTGILRELARPDNVGGMTIWGLSSAVTALAQSPSLDYDRATELEAIGGELLTMPLVEMTKIARGEDAPRRRARAGRRAARVAA